MSDASSSEAEERSLASLSDDHRSVGAEAIQNQQRPFVEESGPSPLESSTGEDEQLLRTDQRDPLPYSPLPASSPVVPSMAKIKQSSILRYFNKKYQATNPLGHITPTLTCRERTPETASEAEVSLNTAPDVCPGSINVTGAPTNPVHPAPVDVAVSIESTSQNSFCNDSETQMDYVMTESERGMEALEPIVCFGHGGPQGMLNKRNDCYLISVLQIFPLLSLQVGSCTDSYALSVIRSLRECHSQEHIYDPKKK